MEYKHEGESDENVKGAFKRFVGEAQGQNAMRTLAGEFMLTKGLVMQSKPIPVGQVQDWLTEFAEWLAARPSVPQEGQAAIVQDMLLKYGFSPDKGTDCYITNRAIVNAVKEALALAASCSEVPPQKFVMGFCEACQGYVKFPGCDHFKVVITEGEPALQIHTGDPNCRGDNCHFVPCNCSCHRAPVAGSTERWIPVSEKLPESEDTVLWCKVPITEPPVVGSMMDEDFEYEDYFTHWMKFPNNFWPALAGTNTDVAKEK